jgi:hypothetical protein
MSQPRGGVVLVAVLLSSFAIVLALGGLFASSAREAAPGVVVRENAPAAVAGVDGLTLTVDPGALAGGAGYDPARGVHVWADRAATGITVCVRAAADTGGWRLRDGGWGTPSRQPGGDARCVTVSAATLLIDLVPR